MAQTVLEREGKSGAGQRGFPSLAVWLEKRCRRERLSYRQVAARAGVSHATIAAITGGARPSAATVVKLAHAFSGNGQRQKEALEDLLLTLCGYRSQRTETECREPLATIIDKLNRFSDEQLEMVAEFADFIAKVEANRCAK